MHITTVILPNEQNCFETMVCVKFEKILSQQSLTNCLGSLPDRNLKLNKNAIKYQLRHALIDIFERN